MPRRRYGYIHEPQKRVSRRENKSGPVRITPPTRLLQYASRALRFVLVLPFKLIAWFFRGLSIIWRGRPKLGRWVLLIFITGIIGGTAYVAWVSRGLPDPDRLTDRQVAQSTKIYDRTGKHLLYEIFTDQKRTLVEFEAVPKDLIKAVIATEDKEFYKHIGIRPLSMLRSVAYGLTGKSRLGSGASTLTQQLVKNAILTNERTLNRKLKEIILALRLEQKYTKEQILKIYFNEIPYGGANYGVEAAAQSYFGKNVSELNLEQIATVAGLPKAPSRYLRDPEALKNRRDFVLERMVEEGYIARAVADETQAQPLSLKLNLGNIRAPHFVFYVREQLNQLYGEQTVDTGGLKVITSLDWDKQQFAEEAVEAVAKERFAEAKANNAALVAIDPKTGHILSLVGSRDFHDDKISGKFDVATQGRRQPGSSFKPIVYAAAFEKGYTPDTILWDVVTNFAVAGNKYEPKNYDLKERGPVTMREAVQLSLNIPAVETLYLVGPDKGVDFAQRLGYTTLGEGNFGLSLVLGGGEVYLLDHTAAYAVFAGGGIRQAPVSILKVEDSRGEILFEWKPKEGERVLDETITATISNILSDDAARAPTFGAGGVLTLPDRPVAAKTGTTNNYVDAWTVGYTPSLVAGVWAGNTDNSPLNKGDGGSKVAAPIWNRFMRAALKDTLVEEFTAPPSLAEVDKPILRGRTGGGITLLIDKVTGKRATSSTPEAYIVEKSYVPVHSILHYVNKDDPRGAAPTDPSQDPQYAIWEAAIQDWIRRGREANPNWQIDFGDPPTEYDDVHSLELLPNLEVIYPRASSTLTSRQIDTDIRVSAPRGVSKVTYKIDERFVGVIRESPFSLHYYAVDLLDGDHVLTIIVEDDIGSRRIEAIPFALAAGVEPPRVSWAEVSVRIPPAHFPRIFFLNPFKLDQIQEVRIYTQPLGGARTLVSSITDLSNLFNNQLIFRWDAAPGVGEYELVVEIVSAGIVRESGRMGVVVE